MILRQGDAGRRGHWRGCRRGTAVRNGQTMHVEPAQACQLYPDILFESVSNQVLVSSPVSDFLVC